MSPLVATSCQLMVVGMSCSVQVAPSGDVAHLDPYATAQKNDPFQAFATQLRTLGRVRLVTG